MIRLDLRPPPYSYSERLGSAIRRRRVGDRQWTVGNISASRESTDYIGAAHAVTSCAVRPSLKLSVAIDSGGLPVLPPGR